MPLLGPIDPLEYMKPLSGAQQAAEFAKTSQDAAASATDLQIKQLALQKAQEAEQRQTLFNAEMAKVASNPSSTGYNSLLVRFPEFAKVTQIGLDKLTEDQKSALEAQMVPALNAMMRKRPDLAVSHLTQIRDGYKNIGKAANAAGVQTVLDNLQSNPTLGTGILIGYLNELMGKDRFDSYTKSFGLEAMQRTAEA